MRIIQVMPTMSYGDAIGNNSIAIKNMFKRLGYDSLIYAENIGEKVPKGLVKKIDSSFKVKKDDIMIYHLSTGSNLNKKIKKYKCKKIVIYHNITPYKYFKHYDERLEKLCKNGIEDVEFLADDIDYCIAVSNYNKEELIKLGYKCKIDVSPILIQFEDYDKSPNMGVINRYDDDYINILFTGRVAPNKKIEDVILSFYYYKKYINEKSRLILVGNYRGLEKYYFKLIAYINKLNLKDVIFTGHIPFDELLSYYKLADIFLCMSEHEGFCVPLVEAMYFDIPIIARDTSAIADTLGGSGILLSDNNPAIAAHMIDKIVTDNKLKENIIRKQQERLKDFDNKKIERRLIELINKFMKEK